MGKKKRETLKKEQTSSPAVVSAGNKDGFSRVRENLLLGVLVLYVFLLGLGTLGEVFEVEWILNLPLFR
ncbi:MAG: hypothetical protein JXR72_01700 [Proteobacteria bacterium]|nr:hypothetical protein [Pseudomonadota bacterium]